jgi:hypothetical protein
MEDSSISRTDVEDGSKLKKYSAVVMKRRAITREKHLRGLRRCLVINFGFNFRIDCVFGIVMGLKLDLALVADGAIRGKITQLVRTRSKMTRPSLCP